MVKGSLQPDKESDQSRCLFSNTAFRRLCIFLFFCYVTRVPAPRMIKLVTNGRVDLVEFCRIYCFSFCADLRTRSICDASGPKGDLGDVVAEMELLEQVAMHFLDGLPTVNRTLVRHQNCVLSENRGDTGRVPFVECVVRLYAICVKLFGYLWIKRVMEEGQRDAGGPAGQNHRRCASSPRLVR